MLTELAKREPLSLQETTILWTASPLAGKTTDWRAGCGRSARPVRREDWSGWVAFAGPSGMPKIVVERIAGEIARLQATPEYAEFIRKGLMEAMPPLSADRTAAFV